MQPQHLALTATLLLLVRNAEALRCWSCSSDTVPDCRDPFKPHMVHGPTQCEEVPPGRPRTPGCWKAIVRLNEVETHVYRSCGWLPDGDFCAHLKNPSLNHTRVLSCEHCTSDGCNGAAPGAPSAAIVHPAARAATALAFLTSLLGTRL